MTVAVRLRPRSKLVISTRIRLLRRSMGTRLARELRRFFAAQARRVVLRLEHGHQLRYEDVKLHDVNALLPPEEDGFLRLVLGPYLDSGIVSFADLAALMVSGATDETRGAGVQRLLDQAGGRIVGINDTTRNAVRDALNEANVQGYNLFQTAHGVAEDGFRGIASIVEQTYAGRAEAIARTEMGWASQAAAQAQWREMGVQQQEIIDGEDSDEECAARNGTTVSIEEDVELLHPNCTVVSLPVVGGEADQLQEQAADDEVTAVEGGATRADLSFEERDALVEYTNNYETINGPLRAEEQLSDELAKTIADLDSAIGKGVLSDSMTLYRTTDLPFELQRGSVFNDLGFVSTTRSKDVALSSFKGDLFVIRTREGTNALDVTRATQRSRSGALSYKDREKEIILPRGSSFVVVDIKNGIYYLEQL